MHKMGCRLEKCVMGTSNHFPNKWDSVTIYLSLFVHLCVEVLLIWTCLRWKFSFFSLMSTRTYQRNPGVDPHISSLEDMMYLRAAKADSVPRKYLWENKYRKSWIVKGHVASSKHAVSDYSAFMLVPVRDRIQHHCINRKPQTPTILFYLILFIVKGVRDLRKKRWGHVTYTILHNVIEFKNDKLNSLEAKGDRSYWLYICSVVIYTT